MTTMSEPILLACTVRRDMPLPALRGGRQQSV